MIIVQKMELKHIDEVVDIEKECFQIPWNKKAFEDEIIKNKMAIYVVATFEDKVVGHGGMWHVINEGHITNIAVKKDFRTIGVGKLIVKNLIQIAEEKEMIGLTLEVRKSNQVAMGLYKNYNFFIQGIRPEYYSDNREDAILMYKDLV